MLSSKTLREFAYRHSADFTSNYIKLVGNGQDTPPSGWAIDYAQRAPIFHVTGVDTAINIIVNKKPLKSHAALHPTKQYGGAVENTVGRTTEFDVACGLDEFVFFSLGKLAIEDTGPTAAFTMHRDMLPFGLASFQDINAMDALILSPSEQFNKDEADQSAISEANSIILGQFIASLVPAADFAIPFAQHLETNYESADVFLQTFSFLKGVIDLPPVGSPAYDELVARIKYFEQVQPGRGFDYFVHGDYYAGPQIMVPSQVDPGYLQSVIFYEGDASNRERIQELGRIAASHGFNVDFVTRDEVNNHVIANFDKSRENITLSELTVAQIAAMNVLFNRKAA